MKMFWYSNMKECDYDYRGVKKLQEYGVTDVVIDFYIYNDSLPLMLKLAGIKPWYRIKLYDEPSAEVVSRWVTDAKLFGCGLAIDCEPYSPSRVWSTQESADKYYNMIVTLTSAWDDLVIYPEIMGSNDHRDYTWYRYFIDRVKQARLVNVLHELTYNKLNLWKYKKENSIQGTITYLGIWPQSFRWKWIGQLQIWIAKKFFDKVFLYTETQDLI